MIGAVGVGEVNIYFIGAGVVEGIDVHRGAAGVVGPAQYYPVFP
jgi:hypothetical protein